MYNSIDVILESQNKYKKEGRKRENKKKNEGPVQHRNWDNKK